MFKSLHYTLVVRLCFLGKQTIKVVKVKILVRTKSFSTHSALVDIF